MSVFRVLHVDDDAAIGDLLETYLEESVDREEFAVTTARSVREAERVLAEMDIDCIVCDYQMPGTDGLEFLRRATEIRTSLLYCLPTRDQPMSPARPSRRA